MHIIEPSTTNAHRQLTSSQTYNNFWSSIIQVISRCHITQVLYGTYHSASEIRHLVGLLEMFCWWYVFNAVHCFIRSLTWCRLARMNSTDSSGDQPCLCTQNTDSYCSLSVQHRIACKTAMVTGKVQHDASPSQLPLTDPRLQAVFLVNDLLSSF